MTKIQRAERADAIAQLRAWIKPGDTVYTILEHVSRSGMSREIRVLIPTVDQRPCDCHSFGPESPHYIGTPTVTFLHPNHAIGTALGLRQGKRDGLVVGGCGMDMGFHLVYELSHVLYGEGYPCLGKGTCPSNYHRNHRDTIQCPGTVVYNPDGPNSGDPCHWERGQGWVIVTGDSTGSRVVCPTCKGTGRLPNPDGPERFDLIHTDGYALRHRWL